MYKKWAADHLVRRLVDRDGSLGIAVIPARCRDKIEGKKQEKTL